MHQRAAVGQVLAAPHRERARHHAQFVSAPGEGVFGARRVLAVEAALHHAVAFQSLEAVREDVGGDSGQAPAQLGKAQEAAQQFQQDQRRPTVAHDFERPRHGSQPLIAAGLDIVDLSGVTLS